MKSMAWRVIAGVVLILMGVLSLLNVLNFSNVADLGWGLLFAAGAAAFLVVFFNNVRTNWWAVIPGFTLAGIAMLMLMDALNLDNLSEVLGGSIFLGMLGAAFWVIFIIHRDYWWAIIPGGVLTSLAVFVFLDNVFAMDLTWLFFMGLAGTFAAVYLLAREDGKRMDWPIWPAGILAAIAVLSFIDAVSLAGYFLPAALIIVGLYLTFRALRGKPGL